MNEEYYMRRAIELALTVPAFPFGAVIVDRASGEIVAEGVNQSAKNPILHGEIVAISRCAELHHPENWDALDLYTTAEPCPMCQSAIEWAGIAHVYYGTSMPYLQNTHWNQITIRAIEVSLQTPFHHCIITGGILEAECNALFDHAPKGRFHDAANTT